MPYFHLPEQVIQLVQRHYPRQSGALFAWNNILNHYNNAPARQLVAGRKMLSNNCAGEIHVQHLQARATCWPDGLCQSGQVLYPGMMRFKNVISLDGGFSEWDKAQKPVVREARYV